ncbi:aminotransferase class III-fold pyridoxal phosphate-dependent enzyme [Aliiruegeria sabulilitoris]|uniref:aminotransferase class III-fold pyridoxal phosphate-dependent enzyme n=1 Tax=Aliiruegeria sabulilitoris TaxID=1510458 RepID=UPI00082BAC94|nr:aminotransferase class III-fold pyridoxal phosphate-dependent enzyme [Aliiruegeria sabulilitoris]NDR58446.1 aminotransferase class III-fold pyridoxal phosphate-dependent enzyme [Pseudoruegeria sp. M32A2M]
MSTDGGLTADAHLVHSLIAAPIMGAGDIVVPPAGYHAAMGEICRYYEIKNISDEVVTAFGRDDSWLKLDAFDENTHADP